MNDHVMGIRTWRDLPDRGGTTQERKRERKSLISGPCLIHAVRPLTNQHVPRPCGGETEHAGMKV